MKAGPYENPKVEEGDFFFLYTDHYDHVAYLSPDMPTFLSFGQWTGIKKNFPEIYLILDVPIEVTIHGGRFVASINEEVQRKVVNGHEFKRYRIDTRYGKYETRSGMTQLVCTTTLKAGDMITTYYGTEIDGEIHHWRTLLLNIIKIPKPGAPKHLFTFFDTFGTTLKHYPDFKHFAEIGFNTVGGFSSIPKDTLRFNVKSSSKAELNIMSWNNERADNYPQYWQAKTIDGKRLNTISPTYRGDGFYKWIKKGKDLVKSGIFIHVTDPERTDGEKVCFSKRSLKQFKAYFTKHYPDIEFVSPLVFMKDPSKYRDYVQAWTNFKSESYAGLYLHYRDKIEQYITKKELPQSLKLLLYAQPNYKNVKIDEETRSSDIRTIRTSMQDPRKLAGVFDFFCPMIYIDINGRHYDRIDMLKVSDEVRNMRQYLKGVDLPIVPALSAGFPYTKFHCDILPNGVMKYQVLEAFASGAKGVGIYSEGFFDALDMKDFAEAISQVLPVENIIAEGELIPTDILEDVNSQTFVKGIRDNSGNAIILVSEYSEQPRKARIIYRLDNQNWTVIDLSDGHEISPKKFLDKNEFGFETVLNKERAKLFWIKETWRP